MRSGLWWGTVEGAGVEELVDAAASAGFTDISITPAMYFDAVGRGRSDQDVRSILDDRAVRVAMIDPLIRGLPGSADSASVGRRFRSTFEHGEDDCYRVAEAVGATAVNVAHFLGAPTPVEKLADAIGGIAERAATSGLDVLVEFMPEGAIGNLETAAAIVAAVNAPNCGLTFDTWHHWRCGGTVEQIRGLPPGTIRAVQLSDALDDVRGSGTAPPTRDRLLPGDGSIPLVEMVGVIHRDHSRAVSGLEVFSAALRELSPSQRAAAAKASFDRLMAAAAGLD